jgi:hypothetical protein
VDSNLECATFPPVPLEKGLETHVHVLAVHLGCFGHVWVSQVYNLQPKESWPDDHVWIVESVEWNWGLSSLGKHLIC